jgi:hypothetical protein
MMLALMAALSLVLDQPVDSKVVVAKEVKLWNPPTTVEVVPLVAAHVLIAFDVWQTLKFRARGTPELNPILGPTPSPAKVILVGGILPMVVLTAVWYALPTGWRIFAPAAVAGAEAVVVAQNGGFNP